jgi:exopolysaccharide production protein ExoZ
MKMSVTKSVPRGEVVIIQQLRGIAALLVILHHALAPMPGFYAPFHQQPGFGQGGVDIFFVISGCVMYVAARTERPTEFVIKRLLRIVPLYWLTTLGFVAMRYAHWGTELTVLSVLKSLFFIPFHRAQDGQIWPVLVPGWSLNVEMFFYLLFAIGLALRRPALIAGTLVSLCVVAGLVVQPQFAALALYSSPIMIEFVIGLLLGHLLTRRELPIWLWPALPLGAVLLLLSDLFVANQALVRGCSGVLVMIGGLALDAHGRIVRSAAFKTLGESSYAMYLVHTPLLLVLRAAFAHLAFKGPIGFSLFVVTALMASVIAGIALHRMVERPLLRLVRHRGQGRARVLAEPGVAASAG